MTRPLFQFFGWGLTTRLNYTVNQLVILRYPVLVIYTDENSKGVAALKTLSESWRAKGQVQDPLCYLYEEYEVGFSYF